MSSLYFISIKPTKRDDYSEDDLLEALHAASSEVEIVEGIGLPVVTVRMSADSARKAAKAIKYARIEPYTELQLL